MAFILEGKQNVELPRYSSDTNRPSGSNLQYGSVGLMRRPDDNERIYQAQTSNYNDNSYQGQVMGYNPNRAGTIFTYYEQGRVIEFSSG